MRSSIRTLDRFTRPNNVPPYAGYPYAYPALFDGAYDDGYPYGYAPATPNTIVVASPAPPVVVEAPPPEPVQSVIHEYNESPSGGPPARAEEETFVIALKDGSRLSASAVWVQSGSVYYIDPESRHMSIPLEAVDREATRRLNRERNLNLRITP